MTPAHFRPLETWIRDGLTLLEQAERAAAAEGAGLAALELKLDGRPTSLATTLEMLRHNLREEYPRLIQLDDPYSMTVVQSSNLNDQYRVGQFAQHNAISSAALRRALAELNAHLLNLPSIELPQSDA